MALTDKEIKEFRKILDNCARPLFFFDDDPDGVCSFLQLYKYKGEGKGVILKVASELTEDFVRKVDEYSPDVVFILDVPVVSQDFLDGVSQKVVWLDHHPPLKRKKVKYFNPRIHDDNDNRPTSYWAYQIAQQDLWLGMTGCVGDWFIPDFKDAFIEKYPGYMNEKITEPDDALFETKVGKLARIISFNLKGSVSECMKSVRTLTRIEHPDEILNKTTSRGKYIMKKFEQVFNEYDSVYSTVKVTKSKILTFMYPDNKTSFTSDLSNELLHNHPKKVIIIGREKDDQLRMSLRSATIPVHPILMKALEKVEGHGGGHDMACGASIRKDQFDVFLDIFKKEIKKSTQ